MPFEGPQDRSTSCSERIFSRIEQLSFGISQSATLSRLSVEEGKGAHVKDADGNWYLDLHAGPGVMSTGHGHPRVIGAMQEQIQQLIHCHDIGSAIRLELQECLHRLVGGPKRRSALLNGGAESVELALRISRQFTGRDKVISFSGGFHGKTLGALACTDPRFRKNWWCSSHNVQRLPFAECSHCSFDDRHDCDGEAHADECIKEIERSAGSLPAALLIEPVQGSAGNAFPSTGFIERLFEYCREHGIVTIADEILTGCGRTGRFLATHHLDVHPDIILLGKGLGSGYPISAVLPMEHIAMSLSDSEGASSTSFGGNPLSAAAAAATLQVLDGEQLVKNSEVTGRLFLQGLLRLEQRYDVIKNIRGRGLMLGFDLDSKFGNDVGIRFFKACLKNGLMVMGSGERVRINPPLIFDANHVEEAIQKLEHSLKLLS